MTSIILTWIMLSFLVMVATQENYRVEGQDGHGRGRRYHRNKSHTGKKNPFLF